MCSCPLPLSPDDTQFRNCIVWLEDQKIRHYKIEDRGDLRNIPSSEWPKAYQKVRLQIATSCLPLESCEVCCCSTGLHIGAVFPLCLCSTCRMSTVHLESRSGRRLWTGYWAWLFATNMETMVRKWEPNMLCNDPTLSDKAITNSHKLLH